MAYMVEFQVGIRCAPLSNFPIKSWHIRVEPESACPVEKAVPGLQVGFVPADIDRALQAEKGPYLVRVPVAWFLEPLIRVVCGEQ